MNLEHDKMTEMQKRLNALNAEIINILEDLEIIDYLSPYHLEYNVRLIFCHERCRFVLRLESSRNRESIRKCYDSHIEDMPSKPKMSVKEIQDYLANNLFGEIK